MCTTNVDDREQSLIVNGATKQRRRCYKTRVADGLKEYQVSKETSRFGEAEETLKSTKRPELFRLRAKLRDDSTIVQR